MIEKRRLAIRKVSIALALAALCFDARTFAPTARANQSPPLFISVTSHDLCRGDAEGTAAVVHDYFIDNGQFCFTIDPRVRIVSISSPLLTLDAGSIPVQGGTICTRTFEGEATALELAQSLVVTFDFGPPTQPCIIECDFKKSPGSEPSAVKFSFTRITNNQLCFSFLNEMSDDAITGVGFELGEGVTPFRLISVIPTPQPSRQNLSFTASRERVPKFNNAALSFALITGNVFAGGNPRIGVQPGETSSEFCVSGAFNELSESLFIGDVIYVHFRGEVGHVQCDRCPGCSGGLTGIVSGSPR